MTKPKKSAKLIAEEHWSWLEPILAIQFDLTRRLYIDAFVHGYKHSRKDK